MKQTIPMMVKPFALGLMALTVMAIGRGVANADEVLIAGYTNGCFNCASPPNTSATQTTSLLGLTYTNSQFSGTTADGFRGLGGNPTPPGVQSVNNLGSFTLNTLPNVYLGNTFTLRVTFTDPEGISGSNTSTFFATLAGTVMSSDIGGVFLNFDNTPIVFTFNDTNCGVTTILGQQTTCGQGSFSFTVNDLAIDPGQTASLTGQITAAQQTQPGAIPEPATLLLLGTGLTGLGAGMRWRYRTKRVSNLD